MKYFRKEFKLQHDTLDKIEKLRHAKSLENPAIKVYDKDIVIEAINYAYSAKYGKDVFDETMSKLELVLGNKMQSVLDISMSKFADALSNIYVQQQQIKEMLLLILKANDIMPQSQDEVNALIMLNDELEQYIEEAVLLKAELHK